VDYIKGKFDKIKAGHYFKFTVMTLVSALCIPASQLIIRGYVIDHFSIQAAGLWEGLNRLSNMYLMIITSSFGVYYLPKLSELTNSTDIKREIRMAYKVIIPCLSLGLVGVYFGRFIIIKILFSSEFNEMADLFLWQIVGDFFKIASWLIAYLMHAKAMAKLFIITEIVFSGLYVGLAVLLSDLIGLRGIILGYAMNYGIYFGMVYCSIYRKLDRVFINSK
jgi:PST family polysaccharide transporter